MKLADWSLHIYRLPYAREVVWANAREDSGLYALLKLTSDDGVTGIAEGTLKNTWSGVSPRSLGAALEDVVLPLIENARLENPQTVKAALDRIPENRLAKALVDNACWTMRAAAAKQPLWQLWNGQPQVAACWTVTRAPPAAMAAESAHYCSRYGFRTLKVKGGQGVETDVQALAAIRAAVGPEVALYVDANSAYARNEALDYVQRIADAGATVAEDPSPLLPDAKFEALQAACPIPVLVDNSCASPRDAALYAGRGARAVSLKPGRIGFSECLAVRNIVEANNGQTAIGIYAESALGTLINLQLQAPMPAEQSFFLMLDADVSAVLPEIRDGKLHLPHESDLSTLVDWKAVKRFAA